MEYRIDSAVIPSGLLTSAKTFSLILRDEGLYIIHIGPANGRPIQTHGLIQATAANATANVTNRHIAKKVAKGKAQLNETGPEALVQQKHSKLLTPEQISEINIKENLREIVLDIRSSQGKYKFRLPAQDKAVAETIKQTLRP